MSSSVAQYEDAHFVHTSASKDVSCISDEQLDLDQLSDVQEFDPQIRQHLEELNCYSTKINHLEKCFEEENVKYQKVLTDSSLYLRKCMKKCGEKNVIISRPYYDAVNKLKSLQLKCQKAALKFEKYNELHLEAKQDISDTELMFHMEMRDKHTKDGNFDQFWQEKLNLANTKFMTAKTKKELYEAEHMAIMTQFREHEHKIATLLAKHKNAIKKSKSYFDEANNFDCKLKAIKEYIEKLEEEIAQCKQHYSQTLRNLESISEEIHERRAQILSKSLKREPGVGAELAAVTCELDENVSNTTSQSDREYMTELVERIGKL